MAHFAQLGDDNIVLRTIVVNNDKILDENGDEQESLGIAHCQKMFGSDTDWVQTSYNASIRKKYATAGFQYIEEEDIFIVVQPIINITHKYKWVYNTIPVVAAVMQPCVICI